MDFVKVDFFESKNTSRGSSTEMCFSFDMDNTYAILGRDNELVGFLEYVKEEPNTITLELFEILKGYRRKGLGTRVIRELFDKHPEVQVIKGLMSEESTDFYNSLNARIKKSGVFLSFEIVKNSLAA